MVTFAGEVDELRFRATEAQTLRAFVAALPEAVAPQAAAR
jgi:hypothetical protein